MYRSLLPIPFQTCSWRHCNSLSVISESLDVISFSWWDVYILIQDIFHATEYACLSWFRVLFVVNHCLFTTHKLSLQCFKDESLWCWKLSERTMHSMSSTLRSWFGSGRTPFKGCNQPTNGSATNLTCHSHTRAQWLPHPNQYCCTSPFEVVAIKGWLVIDQYTGKY